MSRKHIFAAVSPAAFCATSLALAVDETNVAPSLAYGGFCAFGVFVGKKSDGKLCVFLKEEVFKAYLKDEDGSIAKVATGDAA